MDKPDKEDLSDVLSAIREMVRDETRAKFSEQETPSDASKKVKPHLETKVASPQNLPSKILILRPDMRVRKPEPEVFILDEDAHIPHDSPVNMSESFAIANPVMDEGLLRDIVREVVQEQLRGELGKELISAVKRDMLQLLEKTVNEVLVGFQGSYLAPRV